MAACATSLLLVVATVAAVQEETDARLREALRLLRAGDAFGALVEVEAALARDEQSWRAHWVHGQVFAAMGDDLGARDAFVRAAGLDPGNADMHFLAASFALRIADFDSAWAQGIAAGRAGYERREIDRLLRELRRHSQAPPDLEERLRAPRLVVVTAFERQPAPLREMLHRMRSELMGSDHVALVRDAALAAYRLEVHGAEGEEAELEALLIRVADAETLLRHPLPAAGEVSGAMLRELVVAIEREVGGE